MQKREEKPDAQVMVVIHVIDEDEFEIMDCSNLEERVKALNKELEQEFQKNDRRNPFFKDATPEEKRIYEELTYFDCIFENAVEELSRYGETAKELHQVLWSQHPEEMYHTVNVDFYFEWDRDYWTGEEDLFVEYEYEVVESSKEYEIEDLEDEKEYENDTL